MIEKLVGLFVCGSCCAAIFACFAWTIYVVRRSIIESRNYLVRDQKGEERRVKGAKERFQCLVIIHPWYLPSAALTLVVGLFGVWVLVYGWTFLV